MRNKRTAAVAMGLCSIMLFAATPAVADTRNHTFPDSCKVTMSNGVSSGQFPWGQTREIDSCWRMRAGVSYIRASNGAHVVESTPWSVSTVRRTATYPAVVFEYSNHWGDSTPDDCCFYGPIRL